MHSHQGVRDQEWSSRNAERHGVNFGTACKKKNVNFFVQIFFRTLNKRGVRKFSPDTWFLVSLMVSDIACTYSINLSKLVKRRVSGVARFGRFAVNPRKLWHTRKGEGLEFEF